MSTHQHILQDSNAVSMPRESVCTEPTVALRVTRGNRHREHPGTRLSRVLDCGQWSPSGDWGTIALKNSGRRIRMKRV
jgi:hypothetical protein